eukprot:TRINITY_DN638_c0_g1_i1.p1 TRINITY_DN638_c0_g1~~TRINITY_DN638_c0_g1_i1.p1  ORF type:complete len:152 (-),score=28.97 TRINITY_DN638_c0_g1_i1:45-446(-)
MSEERSFLSVIANPLADDGLTKKVLKLTKKAAKEKMVKRGVKEVVKAIRKGQSGLCILAGDISPVDVISHLPVLCEEKNIMYVFVPSKEKLGSYSRTKRPTSCVLLNVTKGSELQEKYDKLLEDVQKIKPRFV